MAENLNQALLITAAGMGLVFAAILLVWLLIWALVRFTAERPEAAVPAAAERERRRRAAAAAVAAALAERERRESPPIPPLPPTAIISAWQAVMRQNQLRKRERR